VLPLNLRGGLADAGQIRSQVPLPETADELCAVARDLRVSGQYTGLWPIVELRYGQFGYCIGLL